MTQKEYVIKHSCNGEVPKCKCGCGKQATLNKKEWRFDEYYGNHGPDGEKVKEIFDYFTLNPNFHQVDSDFTSCKICGETCKNLEGLNKHIGRKHKDISKEEYVIKYFLDGKRPLCACGCGKPTKFQRIRYGFQKYIRGHHIRGEGNNPGKYDEGTRELQAKSLAARYESGELVNWNLGLTTENDERVRKAGQKQSATKEAWSDERKQQMAEAFRKARRDNPEKFNQKKENHSQWKGGSSSINGCVRRDDRYYNEWVFPRMKRDGFTCQECGSTKHLEVHHDVEEVADIIARFLKEGKIQKAINHQQALDAANVIIDYHIEKDVSGITLCKECHCKHHKSYNFKPGKRISEEEQKEKKRKRTAEKRRAKRSQRSPEEKKKIKEGRRKFK